MGSFSKYKIKDYQYWSISLHPNQGFLGRCIVWCKRERALDLTDATPEEQKELFIILKELEKALTDIFQPDLLNYAFLGNEMHHLHGHVIPRYAQDKKFEEFTFTDKLYGHNYQTDSNFSIPPEVIEKIRLEIKTALR